MELGPFLSLVNSSEFGKSLPSQIAEDIARRIFEGELEIGEHLKEGALAEEFQTSRAPVREALYLLQLEGLVERLPRRGTVVKEYTGKELRELYEVRLGLEEMAMNRLQHTWSNDFLKQFHEVLEKMRETLNRRDPEEYARLNDLFHQLVFQMAGNEVLWRLYRQLKNLLVLVLQISTQQSGQLKQSLKEHEAIVQALEEAKFDHAKDLLIANVRHGMQRALGSYQE